MYKGLYRSSPQTSLILRVQDDEFIIADATDAYMDLLRIGELQLSDRLAKEFFKYYSIDDTQLEQLFKGLSDTFLSGKTTLIKLLDTRGNTEWLFENTLMEDVEERFILHNVIHSPLFKGAGEKETVTDKLKLENSEARFRHLVQEGLDMIAILDDEGNYTYVSPTSLAILGFAPSHFEGKNAFDFIHPEDAGRVFENFSALNTAKRITIAPFRFMHANGGWRWIETVVTDLRDEPSVMGIVANSRDITERTEYQNNILLANERYDYVSRATSEAIWDWDMKEGTLFWGAGFSVLFGYKASELKSDISSWSKSIHPEDVERVTSGLDHAIESGASNWSDEYRLLKEDGNYTMVSDRGLVIFGEEGKPVRMVGAIQDISKRKAEEQKLKLLESVVLNTTDSVVITLIDPEISPLSKIIYVNDAFTAMTGYEAEEAIGRSPRILEGERTDQEELNRIVGHLYRGQSAETTMINYKKNGDEFWINFSVTPIADDKGNYNRWISIQRDVTAIKIQEIRDKLLAEISQLFSHLYDLESTMDKVLGAINRSGNFCISEIWLPDADDSTLRLFAYRYEDALTAQFYKETKDFNKISKEWGLPGQVWTGQKIKTWNLYSDDEGILRKEAAIRAGLEFVFGLPIVYHGIVSGVLILASRTQHKLDGMAVLSENFAEHLGTEIKRKQLEQELEEVFTFAPDILAILNYKGYFKKINPAAATLLGYRQSELMGLPAQSFVHPDDREATINVIRSLSAGAHVVNFENRYMTKVGQTKWLSWTVNAVSGEGLIFAVGKDITEKKTLEDLLLKSNSLAQIGSWEINVGEGTVYWSDITKSIQEVEPDFVPDLETGIQYYKGGDHQDTIRQKVNDCIHYGRSWDEEVEIKTFKGNFKWVRSIGQAEMVEGKCVRIFGSFQDIDVRKRAEILNSEIQFEVVESEKRYSDLFHLSPIPMWVYDYETLAFLDVNLSAIHNYGYSEAEFLSMSISDIQPKIEKKKTEKHVPSVNGKQKHTHNDEDQHQTKDGKILEVDIKSNLMYFKGRKARLIIASDVTQQLDYIKAIEEKNDKLEEIAWIQSHRVRAPLAKIMALINLFKSGGGKQKLSQQEIIAHIETSSVALDEIIMEITAKSDQARK
jgi:PAS domain S-box-containing protein